MSSDEVLATISEYERLALLGDKNAEIKMNMLTENWLMKTRPLNLCENYHVQFIVHSETKNMTFTAKKIGYIQI